MELFKSHFEHLQEKQLERLRQLKHIYKELNSSVNVISRKDIEFINTKHILHSLFIYNILQFKPNSHILDLGTGGGFPGIPLAILYPDVNFHLIDGTQKKIGVVQEISKQFRLKNVTSEHIRAEYVKNQKFDFVICRAVASLDKLLGWARPLLKQEQSHAIPNGLFTWKGGDPKKEIKLIGKHEYTEVYPLSKYTDIEYFEEKYIMYVQG